MYYEDIPDRINALEGLIHSYKQNKESLDNFKEVVEAGNQKIKEIMRNNDLTEFTTLTGIKASYVVQKRESFNEEALLKRVKELGFTNIIKTKEYVDMDELENLIYNGELDASKISDCRVIKEVETLRVK